VALFLRSQIGEKMMTNEILLWKRIRALENIIKRTQDPDWKSMWLLKLYELSAMIPGTGTRQ
jgi:hypothetical protein